MPGSTHPWYNSFHFQEESFPPVTSFSLRRCERASSNPLLCYGNPGEPVMTLSRRKYIVSCETREQKCPRQQQDRCLNKEVNTSVFTNVLGNQNKKVLRWMNDWVIHICCAQGLMSSLSRSMLILNSCVCSHLYLGTGRGAHQDLSFPSQFSSLRWQKSNPIMRIVISFC